MTIKPSTLPIIQKSLLPWVLVACGMLFYCFNYFLRISPSVIQSHLTQIFHINATQLGTLVGLYYWSYTPMQIPAGMLYDRFGTRFVLCVASLIATVGLIIFTATDNYTVAGCGRFAMGLGCAFAYIGTLKIASIWLPANRFGTVAGLATAIGMLMGAASQTYFTRIVAVIGYQQSLHFAVITGVVISAIMLLIMRNQPRTALPSVPQTTPVNLSQLMSALRIILRNKQMWLIGAIGCLLYLPSSVFLDLWGIPYLKVVYGITQEHAVAISSCVFYGWIISGPIIGIISDKIIKRRVLPLTFTGFFAALLLCIVFYTPTGIPIAWLKPIFFMIGFCCGAHPLCFALGKENNPIQMSGTAVAATNMFIMMGGAIFQPVVGKLLDMHTVMPAGLDGLPVYSAGDYIFALSVVPIGVAFGIFLSLFVKETYCQSQAKLEDEAIFEPAPATANLKAETEAA